MSNTVSKLMRATLPLAIVIAAGCQDSTGPRSSELDTQAALADYAAMDAVLESSIWESFRMTAEGMESTALGGAQAGAGFYTSGAPLISDDNRGKTFVWDADADRWVADPELTDAPENGVRFILYEPMGAEPDPTKPIGHADLIDLGDTAEGIALRLIVVDGDLTVVDYTTTLAGAEGNGRVTVDGFVQNTRDKLDFEIDVRGQNTGSIERGDITFTMGIADREFSVSGDVHGQKQDGSEHGTVDLTVRHGAASFRVDVESENDQLSGFIDLNDAPFAVVSGTDGHPVFKTSSGGEITGAHALVLWRVFDVTEDVFDLFEDLIEPIAGLVIIAVIL